MRLFRFSLLAFCALLLAACVSRAPDPGFYQHEIIQPFAGHWRSADGLTALAVTEDGYGFGVEWHLPGHQPVTTEFRNIICMDECAVHGYIRGTDFPVPEELIDRPNEQIAVLPMVDAPEPTVTFVRSDTDWLSLDSCPRLEWKLIEENTLHYRVNTHDCELAIEGSLHRVAP